ncbi:hypothetical protein PENSPDRAFT_759192 [Peniophora sp. CONT]|nr:hypothetical protein PENSPDRAFT_759192 [Peniophora sp. CONT]
MTSVPSPIVAGDAVEPLHLYILKPWFMPRKYRDVANALEELIQASQTGNGTIVLNDEAHADLSMRPGGDGKVCFTLYHPALPALASQDSHDEEPPATDYITSALRGLSGLFLNSSSESTLPLVPSHALWGTVEPDMSSVLPVLRGAAHFLRCLRLSVTEQLQCTVEVYRVVEDVDAEPDDMLCSPFIPDGENLWRGGVLEVIPDRKTKYGLTVINKGDKSVYHFYLREGQTRDAGFFKVLVSESPVEPPCFEHGSPFGKDTITGVEKADVWPRLSVTTIPVVM